MSKKADQKLRLLYLLKILWEDSDEGHGLTLAQITDQLARHGFEMNRKTLYDDFHELETFGIDLIAEKNGRSFTYSIGDRLFQLAELKLLVDSVQSAKFITEKQSNDLIKKLNQLVSRHQAKELQRQVVISGRVKTSSKQMLINVNTLNDAINLNRQIRFQYRQWTVDKNLEVKHNGSFYTISPMALIIDDGNYYLVGYNADDASRPRHFRVDKMQRISIVDVPRENYDRFRKFDLPSYEKELFGMFGSEELQVTLEVSNDKVGILIDRFGTDLMIIPHDAEHIHTTVKVAASDQFYGWIIALGENVRIVAPVKAVQKMQEISLRLQHQYGTE